MRTKANDTLNLIAGATRHEIANCLFALECYNALLRERLTEMDPGPCVMLLSRMKYEMEKISRVLDLLHDCEGLRTRHPEWLNVERTIRETTGNHLHFISDAAGLEIYADPMIKMVFFTFVDNAVCHGGAVSEIRVEYRCDENGCTLSVQDNGIGIPDERKNLIFKRGYGDHTGYGLCFARQILGLNNMTIRETGTYGSGARFEILIPEGAYRIWNHAV